MQKCACNDEDLFRTSVYDHGHFESTFSKYAFGRGEGVTKKSTLCTLVKMLTIMDDPLLQPSLAQDLLMWINGNNGLQLQKAVLTFEIIIIITGESVTVVLC